MRLPGAFDFVFWGREGPFPVRPLGRRGPRRPKKQPRRPRVAARPPAGVLRQARRPRVRARKQATGAIDTFLPGFSKKASCEPARLRTQRRRAPQPAFPSSCARGAHSDPGCLAFFRMVVSSAARRLPFVSPWGLGEKHHDGCHAPEMGVRKRRFKIFGGLNLDGRSLFHAAHIRRNCRCARRARRGRRAQCGDTCSRSGISIGAVFRDPCLNALGHYSV